MISSPRIQPTTSVHASAPERWTDVNTHCDINKIPKCRWMKHSFCSEVVIEDIGMFHMTVSQQAEQFRVVPGQWATQKDD